MDRAEFESLWNEDKSVVADIHFRSAPTYGNVFEVEDVEVYCQSCSGMVLNMTYDCDAEALTCNFYLPGTGAVHRYCIGSTVHGDAGRYHQHWIRAKDCVRQQLKHVVRRDDLKGKTVQELWRTICEEGKIAFTGTFHAPEELC